MRLTLAFLTDLHFGPEAYFDGKLRKLSHLGPELARMAIRAIGNDHRPDLLVNLGDDIEDEAVDADVRRYEDCQRILRAAPCPVVNVAGNHDTINLTHDDLARMWGREGHLYYALDCGGFRVIVLHTNERKDVDVSIDDAQLAWLRGELVSEGPPVVILMHHSASEQDVSDSRWFANGAHISLVRERAELRRMFEASGRVRAVFNGHLHRNYLDVIEGIPYVTLQSLVENLDDDAPGRPAAAYAIARFDEQRVTVRVYGNDQARYQIEWSRQAKVRGAS